jgi:hypothetical protein
MRGIDPWIRIRTKMSWIQNTGRNTCLLLLDEPVDVIVEELLFLRLVQAAQGLVPETQACYIPVQVFYKKSNSRENERKKNYLNTPPIPFPLPHPSNASSTVHVPGTFRS